MARQKTSRMQVSQGVVSGGQVIFRDESGRWAAQQLKQQMRACGSMGPDVNGQLTALRTLDTLSKDDWINLDKVVVKEATRRMQFVAAINAAGLTYSVPNAMGKLVLQHQTLTDMGPASVSLDGKTRTENDTQEYDLDGIPLPIIHKDFDLNLRQLEASRNSQTGGLPLDTTLAETAARVVGEACENMAINGGPTFGGLHIYGLVNYPNRVPRAYGAGGNWAQPAKTGPQMITDVLTCLSAAATQRMYGPFRLLLPPNYNQVINNDYNVPLGTGTLTIRQRILAIDGIVGISISDWVPANNMFLIQTTQDVVRMINGVPIQTVQWDDLGGFITKFKVFCIMVPQYRSDAAGRCGIVHMK